MVRFLRFKNLLRVGNDALKLNVPSTVMREAVYMLNDERSEKLADTYEKIYDRQHSLLIAKSLCLQNTYRRENRKYNANKTAFKNEKPNSGKMLDFGFSLNIRFIER